MLMAWLTIFVPKVYMIIIASSRIVLCNRSYLCPTSDRRLSKSFSLIKSLDVSANTAGDVSRDFDQKMNPPQPQGRVFIDKNDHEDIMRPLLNLRIMTQGSVKE